MNATRPEDVRMTFGEHIEELRKRVLYSVYAFLAIFLGTFFAHQHVRAFALAPLDRAMRHAEGEAQAKRNGSGATAPTTRPAIALTPWGTWPVVIFDPPPPLIDPRPVVLSPQEGVFEDVKLSGIVALLFTAPFLLYHLWAFVRAGLYESERRAIGPYLPFTIGLFVAGAMFGYVYLIPMILGGLVTWLDPARFLIQNRLSEYLSLFYTFTFALGLLFEVPVLMMMLTRVGIVTARGYLKAWRWAVLGAVVAGAVINPAPSVDSQLAFAGPLVGLYFLGVGLAYFVERGRSSRAAAPA